MSRAAPGYFLVAAANWSFRGLNAGVQLISTRMLISKLGQQDFGVLSVFLGLAPILAIAEFGLGNGAINVAAEANCTPSRRRLVLLFAAGLAVLSACILSAILGISGRWLGPSLIPESTSVESASAWILFALAGACYTGLSAQQVVVRLLYNESAGVTANTLLSFGSILTLLGVILFCRSSSTALPLAFAALNAGTLISTVFLLAALLIRTRVPLGKINWTEARSVVARILKRGSLFWVVSLEAMLMARLEFVILSKTVEDPAQLTAYRLLSTLGMFIYLLFSSQLMAASPELARCLARSAPGEANQIALQLMRRSALLVTLATLLLLAIYRPVLHFLSPREPVALHGMDFLLFGAYLLIRIWTDTHAQLLLSANRFRSIILLLLPAVVVGPLIQYWLAAIYGITGLVIGLSVPYLLFLAVPCRLLWNVVRAAPSQPTA